MPFDANKLSIIDLISEKHASLRKKAEQRWAAHSNIKFSHAEWYLLSKVEQQSMTISQAAALLDMSRQAMQKHVKKLEMRGYLISSYIEGNKRDKFLALTKEGKVCCLQNNQLKAELEQELAKELGKNEVDKMRQLFLKEWTIE